MAKLTNKYGLPQTLVNFANRNTYSRGDAHISVTQLIGSPRVRLLTQKHEDEIVEDVSDRLWALIGTALHEVVEQGADEDNRAEERLFIEQDGWRISGGVDLQSMNLDEDGTLNCEISDYKLTSTYNVINGKSEWEKQLNCYAHLARKTKNYEITGLAINAIMRDWVRARSKTDPNYPPAPMQVIEIPLWSPEAAEQYFNERVKVHKESEALMDWNDPPECSAEERWYSPGQLAVIKDGRKRALKLFDPEQKDEAEEYAKENKATVMERPGQNKKCAEFCAVSEWCSQWAALKAQEEEGKE
jgi:hypothetical protein